MRMRLPRTGGGRALRVRMGTCQYSGCASLVLLAMTYVIDVPLRLPSLAACYNGDDRPSLPFEKPVKSPFFLRVLFGYLRGLYSS